MNPNLTMKREKIFETIIFDFDYTLADSSKGMVKCVNKTFLDMGLPKPPPEIICRSIGLSLTNIFLRLTGQDSPMQIQEFIRLFIKHADEFMADLTLLYPTVSPALLSLKSQGKKLGIVSTKFRYRIETILRRDNLNHIFDVIVGGEDVEIHKPDPTGLHRAIKSLQGLPANTLYVGDSLVDAETARRADVAFVALLSGMTNRAEFDGYPILGAMENLSDLTAWLSH